MTRHNLVIPFQQTNITNIDLYSFRPISIPPPDYISIVEGKYKYLAHLLMVIPATSRTLAMKNTLRSGANNDA